MFLIAERKQLVGSNEYHLDGLWIFTSSDWCCQADAVEFQLIRYRLVMLLTIDIERELTSSSDVLFLKSFDVYQLLSL